MTKKYFNDWDYTIKEIEIEKETTSFVIDTEGGRHKTITNHCVYKDTPEEVYLFLEEVLMQNIRDKKRIYEFAKESLSKMRERNNKLYKKFKKKREKK